MDFGRAYRVIDRACRVIDMQPPWKYETAVHSLVRCTTRNKWMEKLIA